MNICCSKIPSVVFLKKEYIMKQDIEENDKIYEVMRLIAKKRGAILSGRKN